MKKNIAFTENKCKTLDKLNSKGGMVQNYSPQGYRDTENYNPLTPFSKLTMSHIFY